MIVKIANIVKDDKFIDILFDSLALLNDKWENDYLLVRDNKPSTYKYIKNANRIIFVPKDAILDYLVEKQYDAVFLHSLTCLPTSITSKIDKRIKVFWFSWGKDIYELPPQKPLLECSLIKPETQKELNKLKQKAPSKKRTLLDYLRPLKYRFFDSPANKKINDYYEAIKRIDYFSGVLEYEYDLMKSVPGFRAKKVIFKYISLPYLLSCETPQIYNGMNILIGNSAASTNNHLDIIPYLKKLDLGERKIILPLSYPKTKYYSEDISNAYLNEFGKNTMVLKEFMPAQEYMEVLLSCSIAIFFMERQQAMGNINRALRNGCKVFLSETNPVYRYFNDLGLKIFSVQRDLVQKEIDSPLSIEDIENNRTILSQITNKEQYIRDLNYIYECIIHDKV